jgi:hypothetical protein
MSRNVVLPPTTGDPFYLRPWVVLLAGLVLVVVGLALTSLPGSAAVTARVISLVAGLFTAGAAIGRRLQTAGQEIEHRIETAGLLAVGAFAALLALLASTEWSSANYFLIGLMVIAVGGAGFVLLPPIARQVAASLLILFHFCGIFVASTNVAAPGGTTPWLTELAWSKVYRNYLGYIYMTNAYHFYSPDPGPSTLVWFYIQYDDDTITEIKVPNKKDAAVPLSYTRSMVIADSTNLDGPGIHPLIYQRLLNERLEQGKWWRPEPTKDGEKFAGQTIPIYMDEWGNAGVPPGSYKEPNDYSKRLIASYVRYIAKTHPHSKDPSIPIKHIKVYRATHRLIDASDMAEGHEPMEEIYLTPYFLGNYNTDGELVGPNKQHEFDQWGNPNPTQREYDAFLYWTVPVVPLRKAPPPSEFKAPFESKDYTIRNYMKLHAGLIRSFEDQKPDESKKEGGR